MFRVLVGIITTIWLALIAGLNGIRIVVLIFFGPPRFFAIFCFECESSMIDCNVWIFFVSQVACSCWIYCFIEIFVVKCEVWEYLLPIWTFKSLFTHPVASFYNHWITHRLHKIIMYLLPKEQSCHSGSFFMYPAGYDKTDIFWNKSFP